MKEINTILFIFLIVCASNARNLQSSPNSGNYNQYQGTISINIQNGPSVQLSYVIVAGPATTGCTSSSCYVGWVQSYTNNQGTVQGYYNPNLPVQPSFKWKSNPETQFQLIYSQNLGSPWVDIIIQWAQNFQPNSNQMKLASTSSNGDQKFSQENIIEIDQMKPAVSKYEKESQYDSKNHLKSTKGSYQFALTDNQNNGIKQDFVAKVESKIEKTGQRNHPGANVRKIQMQLSKDTKTTNGKQIQESRKSKENNLKVENNQPSFDSQKFIKSSIQNSGQISEQKHEVITNQANTVVNAVTSPFRDLVSSNKTFLDTTIFGYNYRFAIGVDCQIYWSTASYYTIPQTHCYVKGYLQLFGSTVVTNILQYQLPVTSSGTVSYGLNGNISFLFQTPLIHPQYNIILNANVTVEFNANVTVTATYQNGYPFLFSTVSTIDVGLKTNYLVAFEVYGLVQTGITVSGDLIRATTNPTVNGAFYYWNYLIAQFKWSYKLNQFSYYWAKFWRSRPDIYSSWGAWNYNPFVNINNAATEYSQIVDVTKSFDKYS